MNLEIIDTHTHMYLDQFNDDLELCMTRALESGVSKSLLPNIDASTIEDVKRLIKKFPGQCIGMMGLHPCSVKDDYKAQLSEIKEELFTGNYVAVGEIGIDLYWDKTHFEEQKIAFKEQIGWAKELNLPIVIHARDSLTEIFQILDQEADSSLSGVFHCFTGNGEQAEKALSYQNFYLGIGGVYTFKNSGLAESLQNIPLESLMLETDAPYLTPAPYRGKRNETSYTRLVAEKLAEKRDLTLQEVAAITSQNARKLFKLNA